MDGLSDRIRGNRRPLVPGMLLALAAGLCPPGGLSGEETLRKPAEGPLRLDPEHAGKMAAGLALFKSHARGILIRRCIKCHGGEKVKSELDLATREGLLRGGFDGPAVVVGDHRKSLLYRLVAHLEEPHMPDKEEKLSDEEIRRIARWIDLGAPYDAPLVDRSGPRSGDRGITDEERGWWSFRPLRAIPPPEVAMESWCRTPVDRFIARRLEERGIEPNGTAAPEKLVRRLYFDVIGLPPGPEEVEEFVADPSPEAYDRVVRELLSSPRYGERWARHWLDVARFAESHGFEHDYDRKHAYHYRDFVIRALNRDMPYDRFVAWQLAGDELAPDDPLALMATGFLGAGVFPTQITQKEVERTRYDAMDDMASTTGTAFLGLTIGCARCHDHKFDPIPTKDYYRLLSTFTTTVRSEIDIDLEPGAHAEALAAFEASHAPLVAARGRYEKEELPRRLEKWLRGRAGKPIEAQGWTLLDPVESRSHGGATLTRQDDGSLLASGTNPDSDTYTIVAETSLERITAIRLEALAHPSFVRGGPGRASNGNIGLGDFRVRAEPLRGGSDPVDVELRNPRATFEQNEGSLSIAASIDGDRKTGWAVDPQFGKDHAALFETAGEPGFEGGTRLVFTLEFRVNNKHNIGRLRLSVTDAPAPVPLDGNVVPPEIVEILAEVERRRASGAETLAGRLDAKKRAALLGWYRPRDEGWRELDRRVEEHAASRPEPNLTKVMVTSEGFRPMRHHTQGKDFFETTYFLERGDTDRKGQEATQSFLRVLMSHPDGEKHWQRPPPEGWRTSWRRRALAEWITDTDHGAGSLLARVIVNRIWQHHMGRGIVATPNDFGTRGERPTHPELLEWLATELVQGGWRLNRIHELILCSNAYRQSSRFDEERSRADPENRLFWRREPRRLEAESIRDAMLAVSGELDRRMFGPGTLDEGHKRRSIYFTVKRSRLVPMMQLFDAPEALVSIGSRPSTTIAPQALLFMNNPHVRGYARSFAARLLEESERDPKGAVRRGYLAALSRHPTASELRAAEEFVERQSRSYVRKEAGVALHLALADFCQVLLSLNEFVYTE